MTRPVAMHPNAELQRANSLLSRGQLDDAIHMYDAYLDCQPECGEAWHNRGIALARTRRFAHAAQSFGQALSLYPNSAASWHNRGLALAELGEFRQAIRDFVRALSLKPDLPGLLGDLVLAKLNCCDWQNLAAERRRIAEAIECGHPAIAPFGNLLISGSPADQLQCARLWIATHVSVSARMWRGERYQHDRIRVAYLSGDFRSHPVGALMLPLFEQHDRVRFETFGISFGADDGSVIRQTISTSLEHFIDVREREDAQIATLLREREIDIAVDLMGITADCRPGILAQRPAPVQVNYLGYPATMGAEFIDYIIADRVVVPDQEQCFFTEKIARLPHCYMPGHAQREIATQLTRGDCGLRDNAFVFCCFNNNFKILPETFASWMAILKETENSVLWLAEPNSAARDNLVREAESNGVAAARVIFAPHLPLLAEHLSRLSLADLFLDSLPFNAHSTAIDALSADVPVLTCMGTTMAGRTCASIITAAGLPELVTRSRSEYEQAATEFCRNPVMLRAVRTRLAQSRNASPLFDTKLFMSHFETALTQMHNCTVSGLPPQSFSAPGQGP